MSAPREVIARLETGKYDLVILNYANPDMVGHTGVVEAGYQGGGDHRRLRAARSRKVLGARRRAASSLPTTAIASRNQPGRLAEHRPHDQSRPIPLRRPKDDKAELQDGILADVAPTLLYLLKIPKPEEMTGHTLVTFK